MNAELLPLSIGEQTPFNVESIRNPSEESSPNPSHTLTVHRAVRDFSMCHASLLIVALTLVFALPLQARLGDTERDCVVRYGSAKPEKKHGHKPQPLVPGAREAVYEHKGWQIRVAFIGNRVAAEEYSKPPGHPNGRKIIDAEIEAILTAEKGTGTWTAQMVDTSKGLAATLGQVVTPLGGKSWLRTDGAKAALLPLAHALLLESPEAIRAKNEAVSRSAADKRKNVPKF